MAEEGASSKGRGWGFTVESLEDSFDGAGAAAAGHGDVEFVDV